MRKLDQFVGGERGLSPVIGVILMISMTVALAALVAVFIGGVQIPTEESSTNAGADFSDDTDGSVTVRYVAEGGAETVRVKVNGSTVSNLT